MRPLALLALLALTGCASRRALVLETRVLEQENRALREDLDALRERSPNSDDYVAEPTLADVERYLTRLGYEHRYDPERKVVLLPYEGLYTSFTVRLQIFPKANVLFMATTDYFRLSETADVDGVALLLVQLVSLNFDLLLGKLQLDPETGEILLSQEVILADGLGFDTFERALEQLLRTADLRYPELERAASGAGL